MVKEVKTFGYDRRSKVPHIEGTTPKLCPGCDSWFAAYGRERRCDVDVPETERLKRLSRRHYASLERKAAHRPSQGRTAVSELGHPTIPKRRRTHRAPQVTGVVSDGGALCRELAEEMAVIVDLQKGRPRADIGNLDRPMTLDLARRYTRRNVALGLQGRADLERYVRA